MIRGKKRRMKGKYVTEKQGHSETQESATMKEKVYYIFLEYAFR